MWRLQHDGDRIEVHSHTGRAAAVDGAHLDEHGRLFLATDLGLGIVHTLDMEQAARAVESGAWRPADVRFDSMPARFGYRLSPAGDRLGATPAAPAGSDQTA